MKRAYKYRIYPNREQEEKLAKTLNTCRILYNHMLAERRDKYGNDGRSPSFYEQKRGLVNTKNTNHYLQDVHSQVLQDVTLRIDRAFNAFFDRARKKASGMARSDTPASRDATATSVSHTHNMRTDAS